MKLSVINLLIFVLIGTSACSVELSTPPADRLQPLQVIATESFLADLAQNVAGDRLEVGTLIPEGVDPHEFQPTPKDIIRLQAAQVVIINGASLEPWIDQSINESKESKTLIIASEGLIPRSTANSDSSATQNDGEIDPHFWLNPLFAINYIENIRDGLSKSDPAGANTYSSNASLYIDKLHELDIWATEQLAQIPTTNRLLVTNHESLGYFADRYNLKIIGTILPSVSAEASPSAKQMENLVKQIQDSGAPAIFIEVGANPEIAEQIALEANVQVVTNLYTHFLSSTSGPASTYIEMMRHNISLIVGALR